MNAVEECVKLQADQLLNDELSFKSKLLYNTAVGIDIRMGNQYNKS